MTRLYLVRHAWPELRPDLPPETWPLAPEGQAAARSMGRSLAEEGIVAVRASPEPKAAETGELIARGLGVPCSTDPDLGEARGRRWLQDGYEAAIWRFFSQPDASPDGWEPAAAARDRFVGAVARFATELEDAPGLVVAHGLVLSLFMAHLRGAARVELDEWRSVRMPDLAVVDLAERRIMRPFGAPTPYRAEPGG